ncbi:MAG: hypothetical protein A3B38_04005 [Candidatus Levybacteria bacterium RIFCSPLOWO2_01_FULL_36_13]|nr:MAG: hypothetical protein A2684_04460 [Candidatus Levybacteria bacterium RIFCSPHIGHO2_01_FULL_36_15b]OGH34292.1 MAG: hypothetical protein A3B38_04005 [Candidatus Levybacteria bacterium RIFCSPLOWO2_01_FULL_36_13]
MQPKLNSLFKKFNKEQYGKYLELIPNFKKEKAQKFTTIVLTIIAIIMLAIFAINPTLSTIANLQKQLDDAKFVVERLDTKINNLSVLQTKYETLKPNLPIIYESVPKNEEVALLTGQLQAVAGQNNIAIISIQSDNFFDTNNFSYFTFSISMQGRYEDLINFLNTIINMQRIIGLDDINITSAEEENKDLLNLSLKGVALYKK